MFRTENLAFLNIMAKNGFIFTVRTILLKPNTADLIRLCGVHRLMILQTGPVMEFATLLPTVLFFMHLMMYSGLVFQSKTIRTMVFVPIALGVESRFHFPPMSLALPVSMLIEHCYVLPFNSKPAALLYNTNQYSQTDAFKYGITMMTFSWFLILVFGETVLKWLHITPGLFI